MGEDGAAVENARKIREELPEDTKLMAATKGRSVDEIRSVLPHVDMVGENYVQEGSKKYRNMDTETEFRLIGHLQKNKINDAIGVFDGIDSVESVYRAKHINKRVIRDSEMEEVRCPMPVMVEVNIAEEESKYGAEPEEGTVERIASEIRSMEGLKLEGMMTMGPHGIETEKLREYFRRMNQLFEHVQNQVSDLRFLSMGMSKSYRAAVEEGSNLVRIGTGIFGPRDY